METAPRVVPKARKSLARLNSIHSSLSSDSSIYNLLKPDSQTPQSTTRQELIHVAEVHDSKTKLIASSEDEEWVKRNGRRKKRPKTTSGKKKFREPKKGEETDTLSEIESGAESMAVADMVKRSHRPPRKGSATDTLSEASDSAQQADQSLLVPSTRRKMHRLPRKGSATDTLSEESDAPERAGLLAPTQPAVTSPVSDSQLDRPKVVSKIPRPSTAYAGRKSGQDRSKASPEVPTRRLPSRASLSVPESVTAYENSPRSEIESQCLTSPVDSFSEKSNTTPVPAPRTHGEPNSQQIPDKVSSLSTDEPESKSVQRTRQRKKKLSPQLSERPPSSYVSDSDRAEASLYGNESLAVTVHGCDPLRFLDFARSPFVRLHVVDSVSGDKLSSDATVLQTKPFHLKINRTVTPCWEEDLVANGETSSRVVTKRTVLLFEVIDQGKRERVIAWAFLKLIAPNGADNMAKMLRLQLFKPPPRSKSPTGKLQCFVWWSKGKYSTYSSTLYVSVNTISVPDSDPTLQNCSDVATEGSQHKEISKEVVSEDRSMSEEEEVVWTRLGGQSCKLPTIQVGRLECGRDGSLCLAFSHSGRSLAAPAKGAILIYGIPSLRLRLSLYNHSGIVHDLSWSPNDNYLLTASADSTACIWAVSKKLPTPFKVLSHPTYVYSCCWVGNETAVTGCLDGHIRLWSVTGIDQPKFLTKHRSKVNALASAVVNPPPENEYIDSDNEEEEKWMIISGDSSGMIALWQQDVESGEFNLEKELTVRELNGQVINRIVFIPGNKRILVLSRDSLIRMIDIATSAVLQYYQGGVCVKTQGSMALCGCSRRVWSWSEEGCIMVWDLCSGAQLAVYSDLQGAIALHPLEHMVAVVPHRPDARPEMIVASYDRTQDGRELGLVIFDRRRNKKDSWSARAIPLQPIPAVRIQPPPGLRFSKGSRTPSPRPGAVSPAPQFKMTRAFSGEIKHKDKKEAVSPVRLEPKETTPRAQDRDSRLSEIIDKMDNILLQASPKQTTCA